MILSSPLSDLFSFLPMKYGTGTEIFQIDIHTRCTLLFFAAGASWHRVHISCAYFFWDCFQSVVLIYFVVNLDTGTSPSDIVFCSQDDIQNKKEYRQQ